MMKRALFKDSVRQIKVTYKRFISILLMAFLGVGFFAGMRAASPDMVDTINNYYVENEVYDIQILSTLGLTNDDIDVFSRMENVEKVVGTYEMDGRLEIGNKEVITKIMCVEDLNKPILIQGNMPQSMEECVVEESFFISNSKNIGDTIEVEVDNTKNDEGDEVEYLNDNKLKIVGVVQSPLYISRDRGTSNLGSGKVDCYMYISRDNIKAKDVYTSVYVKLKDSKNYTTSTKEYEDYVETTKQQMEDKKDQMQNARYEKLVSVATKKVDDAQNELNLKKDESNQKLDDAQKQIDDGKSKIQKAETELENSKKQANTQLTNAEKQINQAKNTISQNETQLNIKEAEFNKQSVELKKQKQDLQTQLDALEKTLTPLQEQYSLIKENEAIPEEQKKNMELQLQTLEKSKQTLEEGINKIDEGLSNGEKELENAKIQLQTAKSTLKSEEQQYKNTKKTTNSKLESARVEIQNSKSEIQKAEQELQKSKQEFENTIKDMEDKLLTAREKIKEIEHPKMYILDRYGNSGYNSFIQDTESVDNIAKIFPIVFFVIATLISLTSMTRMVEEQRTQIGTLKALGYSKLQIVSKYIMYASSACIIGGILGMCVGFVLLPKVIWLMYQMMYQISDIHISFALNWGLIGLLLISFCIIGATVYVAFKELVNTPANLMRPKAPKMGKRVILEKIPIIWKHLKFSQKVTVRNIFRYKKRFLMTIIGIMGCTSLILVGFGLQNSITSIMPKQFENVFNYDMQISLKTALTQEEKQDYISKIQEKAEISKIVEVNMLSNTAANGKNEEEVQIIVPKESKDLSEIVTITDIQSKKEVQLKENEVAITDKMAELLNVKVGDFITLKDSNENERKIKISNIVENYISHYIYMLKATYEDLYDETYDTNVLFIQYSNINEEQEDSLASELLSNSEVATVSRISSIMNMLDDTMKSLNYVVIILIVSAGLLAFVVLYNLANVNISERIRELATIKVLGFYDREVYEYITRETVILTIIGIVIGLVAGYFLNSFIIGTCEINMLRFPRVVNPISYVYATLITVGFTIIVNIATYFALKKIDMIESLKSVE